LDEKVKVSPSNVTLDKDGMIVQCMYKEAVLIEGYISYSQYGPVEATLAVFAYAGENMVQYGGSVRNRMDEKNRIIKNIVASTQI
jgi:hypothetical protein